MARICIAIPTYEGRELLERYLPSVVAQDADVVVVDDGSTDDTAAWLAAEHPSVRYVHQPNQGVSVALNRCLREAADADYVLLLNNDVELTPEFAGTLADTLDRHPEAGSACGKMLMAVDHGILDGAGDLVRWSGGSDRRGHSQADRGQYDTPEPVLSPCGGAAMYRQTALADVGQFDADFVAYYEDVDWGLRAQLLGWSCRYEPTAVCFHEGSATTQRVELSDRHTWLMCRNTLLLLFKNFPTDAICRHLPFIVWHNLGWLRMSIWTGKGLLHLRAWVAALRLMPAWRGKRRTIQTGRRISTAQLGAVITPRGRDRPA